MNKLVAIFLSLLILILSAGYIYTLNNNHQNVLGVASYIVQCNTSSDCKKSETCRHANPYIGYCAKKNTPYYCNSKTNCGNGLYCRKSGNSPSVCDKQGNNDPCKTDLDCGKNRFCDTIYPWKNFCQTKCNTDSDCGSMKSCLQRPNTSIKYCIYTPPPKCTTDTDCKTNQYCYKPTAPNSDSYCETYVTVTFEGGQTLKYTQEEISSGMQTKSSHSASSPSH